MKIRVRKRPKDALAAFCFWCRKHGIEWDADKIRVAGTKGAYKLVALRFLESGQVIIQVPQSICITTRSSYAGQILRQDEGYQKAVRCRDKGDPLPLTICLLYEIGLGLSSLFAPYIRILPRVEPGIPFTWPADKRKLLQGTEVHAITEVIDYRKYC